MTDEMKANYETLLDALTNEMQALHKELQECKEKLSQEPCEDVVSRQAVLDLPRIKTHNVWGNVIYESVDVENVRQLPSVSPQQKIGRWIMSDDGLYRPICNNCGAHPWKGYIPTVEEATEAYKYCPTCGAKMQEVENETNN